MQENNQPPQPKGNMRVKEDMICPVTKEHCDDECCPVGAICNLSGNDEGISPDLPEIKTVTATIPEEEMVQSLYGLGKALSIIQEKRDKQAGLGGLEHCIRPAYDLLNNLLNKK